jgi:hypothetical protein
MITPYHLRRIEEETKVALTHGRATLRRHRSEGVEAEEEKSERETSANSPHLRESRHRQSMRGEGELLAGKTQNVATSPQHDTERKS